MCTCPYLNDMTGHIPDTYIPHIIYHNINIHYCTNMMYLVENVEVICIAMITMYSMLLYFNSLNGEFVMDDTVAVVKNDDLRSELTTWKELFENDYWGTNVSAEESHKSYRPFTVMTFRLNYYYGELEPFGYHIYENDAYHQHCNSTNMIHGHLLFLLLLYYSNILNIRLSKIILR